MMSTAICLFGLSIDLLHGITAIALYGTSFNRIVTVTLLGIYLLRIARVLLNPLNLFRKKALIQKKLITLNNICHSIIFKINFFTHLRTLQVLFIFLPKN